MSIITNELKSRLNSLQHKAEGLGNLLFLQGEQLENEFVFSHDELLAQLKSYNSQKDQALEQLLKECLPFGRIHVEELYDACFGQLEPLMEEVERRQSVQQSLQQDLLPRIHALPRDIRQPLLTRFTEVMEGLRKHTLWETPVELNLLSQKQHPMWEELSVAEQLQKSREAELEAVAREKLAHVTKDQSDETLEVLAGMHNQQVQIQEVSVKETSSSSLTIADQSDLIFDDTFDIGKNMSLLKGRDLFPAAPKKQISVKAELPVESVLDAGDNRSVISKESREEPRRTVSPQADVKAIDTSRMTDQVPLSYERHYRNVPPMGNHFKSPLSKLRIDHGKAMLLAEMVLQSHGETREHRLIDLVWELVRQRRFGLASLLAERCGGHADAPPSWLLRVLALSSSLYFPRGEVSRLIEKELLSYKSNMWAASHQEEQQSLGYLLRAAVLRLSLINPSKVSSSILKSFSIKDGEVQLYNFCSRLVYSGGSSTKLASMLFISQQVSPIIPLPPVKTIEEEITHWVREIRHDVMKFQETPLIYTTSHWSLYRSVNQRDKTALWSYIASTHFLNQVYKMLMLIRKGERGATSRVRQDLHKIKEGLNQPQLIGLKMPRDIHLMDLLSEKVQGFIQQGINIADRWLIAESPSSTTKQGTAEEFNHLKEEVHRRFSAVMQELSQLRFESQSENRVISLECLMEAFQDIRMLVDQQYELPPQEVFPTHVIQQELLRTSLTEFDEQWQVNITPQEKEKAILEMLTKPELTWTAAMKRIAGRGAWPILKELREMPNMLNFNEQKELEHYLKYIDDPEYRDVMLQLAQLQQEMKQAEQLKLISTDEYQACYWRISQISQENPEYWQLKDLKLEIELLKKFLEQKRQEEQERIQARFVQLNEKISLPFNFNSPKSTSHELPFEHQQRNVMDDDSGDGWILDLD